MSKDRLIVGGQLVAWLLLVMLTDLRAVTTTPHLLVIAGLGASLWAISAARLGPSYSSSTEPGPSNVLVLSGTYRYVRHPIYTGMLIVASVLLLSRPRTPVVVTYVLMALVTNFRASREEALLECRYPEYAEYRKRTKRYIPFIL